jgi:hypothetical protein
VEHLLAPGTPVEQGRAAQLSDEVGVGAAGEYRPGLTDACAADRHSMGGPVAQQVALANSRRLWRGAGRDLRSSKGKGLRQPTLIVNGNNDIVISTNRRRVVILDRVRH